jgi:hypothetical protein
MPQQETVEAALTYSIDTGKMPVNQTFEEGNVERAYTGEFANHNMTISDGRSLRDQLSLDVHGFELADHKTKMKNFLDEDEIKSVYYPEVDQLIKDRTGASRVVIFDHTVRIGDEKKQQKHQTREPVLRVHNDYTDWSGPQRVRDLLPPDEAEELLKHRFAIVQAWRPIQDVLKTNPLAIADSRSLAPGDLIISERRYPDRVGQTYQIAYNPDHQWFYFPDMTRDEAIVFKVYESETDGRARWTAHTSFDDPTTPTGAPARESIEMRTLAFFEPN